MIPQQGLASLPQAQQGPMPGQAPQGPIPGVMPQQGAATPRSYLAPLKGYSSDQLKMLVDQKPSWALLTAYNEALKREARIGGSQGQAAQQAAAATQGRTVKDDMLAQPVMAAHGGEMHSYADGGAVAFAEGGRTLGYAPDYELARKYGIDLSPYDAPEVRAEKIKRARAMAGFEEQSKSSPEIPVDRSKLFPFGVPESPMMPVPEIQVRPSASAAPAAAGPGRTQRRQPTATPDAGIASVNPYRGLTFDPTSEVGPEVPQRTGLAALEAADVEAAQKRLTQDPEVRAAQEALQKSMVETAEARRSRAQQGLDEVLKRGRTSVFEDPEALLRIAAGMDTRKGKGIGSLAGGISGVMGERRKEAADARTLFNKEMDVLDNMKQLQMERDLLIKQGRVTEAQAAEDKLRAVRKEYEGIRYSREKAQTEEARQQFVAESGRMSAEASQEQARAATKTANARAAGVGEKPTTPYQLAQLRDKARDNLKETLPMILLDAKRQAQKAGVPFDRQAAENEAIDREMERLMPGLSGKKPTAAPAPGQLSPEVLNQFKVRPVGQ